MMEVPKRAVDLAAVPSPVDALMLIRSSFLPTHSSPFGYLFRTALVSGLEVILNAH